MSEENKRIDNLSEAAEEDIGRSSRRSGWVRGRRRNTMITVIVLIMIVISALIVILTSFRGYRHAAVRDVARIAISEEASYVNMDGFVISYSRDSASCTNSAGNEIWNEQYEMQQPVISVSGDRAAIADRGGTQIKIISSTGVDGSVNTDMPIRAVSVSESGVVAAVLDDTDVTWVYLYNSDGSEIAYFKTTMDQSGYPLYVALSPSGTKVCISSLQVQDTMTKTVVTFYDFSKGSDRVEGNYVNSFEYSDEIITYVKYISEKLAVGVSDKRFVYYSGEDMSDNSVNISFNNELLRGAYASTENIGLLFPDTESEEEYRLDVYDKSGTKVGAVRFTMDFTSLQIYNNRIYVHNDQECRIYSMQGREIYNGTFGMNIDLLIPSSRPSRITIITGEEIKTVDLS